MDINKLYNYYKSATGVSIDTRTLVKGNIFFAINGENFNGNNFNKVALEKGAILIVTDDDTQLEKHPLDKVFLVEDTLTSLQSLSNYHRKQLKTKIIALTGSNGKTTSKELLYQCLSTKYNCIATKGNLNNHIGVPLTLLTIKDEHEFAIVEMGANHQKEIDFLCNIALPDFGFITNIGKAHLEGFGGIEGVKKGKSELYKHLALQQKLVFCDRDDETLVALLPLDSDTHFYKKSNFIIVKNKPFLEVTYKGIIINSNITGDYNIGNIAVAVSISNYFGVEIEQCANAISQYFPDNNRSQLVDFKDNKMILDAYNANPTSMRHSIENAYSISEGKVVLILGDMLEMGDASASEHKAICEFVSSLKPLSVFYIGQEFRQFKNDFDGEFYENTLEAKPNIDLNKYHNIYILLKGSRGIGLEKLLN
jgi:UDP-N-acetylmuramoyl-tripeptide--D-alanyl-D-alanine ligase